MKPNDNPQLRSRVEEALSQLRPYLEADSGNVSLVEISDDGMGIEEEHLNRIFHACGQVKGRGFRK